MMQYLKKFTIILKNKYVIITIIFLVWLIIFDQNNLISQIKLSQKFNELKQNKKYYKEQIVNDTIELNNLLTKPENLEKFARENYLMKRSNEDIFIIIKDDSSLVQP